MFIKEVVKELNELFGVSKEYSVAINHVYKNNGVKLDGVVISKKGQKIAPNIYLNSYYEMYKDGMTMHNIIDNIIDVYYESSSSGFAENIEMDFTYESIKDKIVYKVVNFKNNTEMLKRIPFIKFLDLAVIFQYNVDSSNDGLASVRITNAHIKEWGISKENLYQIAKKNTPRLFPCVMKNMEDVLKDLVRKNQIDVFEEHIGDGFLNVVREDNVYYMEENEKDIDGIEKVIDNVALSNSFDMYVLSNVYGINGASAILYKGVLSKFADKLRRDLYIIPSSIHEVIVIPKCKEWESTMLKEMVRDVNTTQVPREDVLANSVYEFNREINALRLL